MMKDSASTLAVYPPAPARPSGAERHSAQTQFLIFTLFGEYVLERGGKIWTSSLLYLMELLGAVSELAVRSTLSRMTRKGWIAARKVGRRSQYSLTGQGRKLLERGKQRIFEPVVTDWDGQWRMVVYSLPEDKRKARRALRTQLYWLGFGPLGPGTWISPHPPSAELENIFAELGAERHVQRFTGVFEGPISDQELVRRCWNLESLEPLYQDFINRFLPEFLECEARVREGHPLGGEECFVRLFWLTHAFQSFPFKDPNLPTSLLPADWIGITARRLFENYHQLLSPSAIRFADEVIGEGSVNGVR